MADEVLAFGPFRLDPERGVLLRDGEPLALGRRALDILATLLRSSGLVVTKAELIDAAWPGLAIEESNLSVQIAALRKALGAPPGGGEWIATVNRVGYRLVAAAPNPAEAAASSSTPAALPLPMIAVMPFRNLGADPEQDYFADGIVEDLIAALSRFRSFGVIARDSSFVYKGRPHDARQVGRDLDAGYLLEGSVRRAGRRLRIVAEMIDTASGANLWARNFDGEVGDVFDFQDRIAESVAVVVEPHIRKAEIERSRRKRPENLNAYDLYLRGLERDYARGPASEAFALFNRAIELEPGHAPFLAAAAWLLEGRIVQGLPPLTADDRGQCMDLAGRAQEHAYGDGEVLARCGLCFISVGRDYERGLHLLRSGMAANPNNVQIIALNAIGELQCGDLDAAVACTRRAIAMNPADPGTPWAMTALAHVAIARGDYRLGLAEAERSIAVNPGFLPTYWMLIAASAQLGMMAEARSWLARFRALAPGVTLDALRAGQPQKDRARIEPILEGLRLAGLP